MIKTTTLAFAVTLISLIGLPTDQAKAQNPSGDDALLANASQAEVTSTRATPQTSYAAVQAQQMNASARTEKIAFENFIARETNGNAYVSMETRQQLREQFLNESAQLQSATH